MAICSICSIIFLDVTSLLLHLKFVHGKIPYDNYDCVEYGCSRTFPNSFKKHLKTHNFAANLVETASQNTEGRNLYIGADSLGQNCTDVTSESGSSKNVKNRLQNFSGKLESTVVKFLCKLYADNTLSRKNIQTSVCLISEFLITPLADLKTNIIDR